MLKGYMARESLGTPSLVKLTFFIQRCCETVHITICSNLNFSPVQSFCCWAWPCKYLRKIQMAMKTNNAIVNWGNNIIFDGSQIRYFFHKTILVRLQKANHVVVYHPCREARTKIHCEHFYKDSVSPNQLQHERNVIMPIRKRTCDV